VIRRYVLIKAEGVEELVLIARLLSHHQEVLPNTVLGPDYLSSRWRIDEVFQHGVIPGVGAMPVT
jgi:hypothetical protein